VDGASLGVGMNDSAAPGGDRMTMTPPSDLHCNVALLSAPSNQPPTFFG
jgi:hypothetical protein